MITESAKAGQAFKPHFCAFCVLQKYILDEEGGKTVKKCLLIVLILCCGFVYSCTETPDDPEPRKYEASYAALSQGYGPAVKDGVAKAPKMEYDIQYPEQQVLTMGGKTYVLDFSSQYENVLNYRYFSGGTSITYSIFADTGEFASISIASESIKEVLFQDIKTEAEYLEWIKSKLVDCGIDDLDEYVYNCQTLSALSGSSDGFKTPDDLIGYDFTFTRYVDGIETDDVARVFLYDNTLIFTAASGKFDDFDNATIDKLQCDAVADSFMQGTLADGWSFTSIEFDNCMLKSSGDLIYLEYSYLVELRNSTGDETSTAYVINVFLK